MAENLFDELLKQSKCSDYSYESAQTTLTHGSAEFRIELANLIKKWMDCERVNSNRREMGFKLIENPYLSHIKCLYKDLDIDLIRAHFLLKCRSFRGDYFNGYNPLEYTEDFISQLNQTQPAEKLPENEYYGHNWSFEDLKYVVKDRSIVSDQKLPIISQKGNLITLKLEQPLKINYWSQIEVRDLESPYPGVIMSSSLQIDNLKQTTEGSLTLSLRLPFRISDYEITQTYNKHKIPCPRDDKESMCLWLDQIICKCYQSLVQNGFKLVG